MELKFIENTMLVFQLVVELIRKIIFDVL